jgi:hypothetical protein
MSVKYNGVLLLLPILVCHVLRGRGCVKDERGKEDLTLLLAVAAMGAGFAAGTPYAFVDVKSFLGDAFYEAVHLGTGHGIVLGRGWLYHLRVSLLHGLGVSLLAAGVIGMVILARKDIKAWLLLCAFPVTYYAVAGRGYTVFVRYALPVVPFLCITAAYLAVEMSERLGRGMPRMRGAWLSIAVCVMLGLPSLARAIRFNVLLSREDNRLRAARWIRREIPRGTSLYQACSFWGKVRMIPGYRQWDREERAASFRFRGRRCEGLPEYVVVEWSPLRNYSTHPAGFIELLEQHYVPVRCLVAADLGERGNVYDHQDAFYLPFAGFRGVECPGPNLEIYRRRE